MGQGEDLVTVYETDLPGRVAVIKMALAEAGIRYIAEGDILSAIYPTDGMAVVRFQVCRRDEAAALDVLRRIGFTQ
ncbi:MAG: putative signal transducing protein [Planctomycetota bacterium]